MFSFNRLIIILLMVGIISLNCTKKSNQNELTHFDCPETKMELLINEVLKKDYFIVLANSFYDKDSSFRYNYFYLENIIPRKKEYYVKVNYNFKNIKVDSLKLRVTNNPEEYYMDANELHIKLKEINNDTTQVKLYIDYGTYNKKALNWSDYTFTFDVSNCKWNVKDSIFNEY